MNAPDRLAANIRLRMDALGITQAEVSHRMRCSPSLVHRYYHAKVTRIDVTTIARLALALECEPDELL